MAEHCADEGCYPITFPSQFVEYCKANGIPSTHFTSIPQEVHTNRYIRCRTTQPIAASRPAEWKPVDWLPCGCFRIPRSISLRDEVLYRSGGIVSMDAASMASVVALSVRPQDAVLDLCCCPGMKLLLIGDALVSGGAQGLIGHVVGVDVNLDRLFVARSLIEKYKRRDNVSLLRSDGTSVNPNAVITEHIEHFKQREAAAPCPPSDILSAALDPNTIARRVSNANKFMERQRKRRRDDPSSDSVGAPGVDGATPQLIVSISDVLRSRAVSASYHDLLPEFDRILVDAECSHDGSVFHLDLEPCGASPLSRGITNANRMTKMNISSGEEAPSVVELQYALLRNAFQLCTTGGSIVYSTCSFSAAQNEDLVTRFLVDINEGYDTRRLVSVAPFAECCEESVCPLLRCSESVRSKLECEVGETLSRTITISGEAMNVVSVRFWPHKALTSFQFVAKFVKLRA